MAQHPFHIFECLRELNNIVFSPVRDFSAYDDVFHLADISFAKYSCFFSKHQWPYWFTVKRPNFDGFPVVPAEIADWIGDWGGQTPMQQPKVKKYYKNATEFWKPQVNLNSPPILNFEGERFDEQPKRIRQWTNWLNNEWQPWAEENVERFAAIQTYEQFCRIFHKLERNRENLEFVAANAVLCWRFDSIEIRHPLITQSLELEYLPEEGIFNVVAKGSLPRFEYDMLFDLTGIDMHKIFMLEQKIFEHPVCLRDGEFLKTFCEEFASIIGYDCLVSSEKTMQRIPILDQPCIYYNEPVFFLRYKDGRKWRGELEGIVEAIDAGASLPNIFNSVHKNEQVGEESATYTWKDNLAEPFLPWVQETAHKDILRQLLANPLTVVQSPPRSFKENLIVNILTHLLAQGKRVLITGGCNSTLREVGKLLYRNFPELSPLCVGAVETDRENMIELLSSLREHSRKNSCYDKDEIEREVTKLQKQLAFLQKELIEDKVQVQSARELEYSRRFIMEGEEKFPWQIARWIELNNERLGYIPDEIGHDKECPLNKSEMNEFIELLKKVSLSERAELSRWFPKPSELMSAKELTELFKMLEEFSLHKAERVALLEDCLILEDVSSQKIKSILQEYQQALANLPGIEEEWLAGILEEIIVDRNKLDFWQDFYDIVNTSLQKLQKFLFILNNHIVELPSGVSHQYIREVLYKLRTEFSKNNKLSILFKLSAGKKIIKVYEKFLIDGALVQNSEDIDLVLCRLDYLDELNKIVTSWNTSVTAVSGPIVEGETEFAEALAKYNMQIKRVVDWCSKHLKNLNACWEKFANRQPAQWADRNWVIGMLSRIQAWLVDKKQEEYLALLAGQYEIVFKEAQGNELNPSCYKLKEALDKRDVELWQKSQKKLVVLEEKKMLFRKLDSLYTRLSSVAPLWAQTIVDDKADDLFVKLKDWQLAWLLRQAKDWLTKHKKGNNLEEITQRFYQRKDKTKDLIKELCTKSAWQWQLKRVTDDEKKALNCLLEKTDLQYTDNLADRQTYEFLREVDFWRLSIPAWIMPVNTLLETAGAIDKMFDVVIVADGEKCDIFSSCLLTRGKKALVLGDNMLLGNVQFMQGRAAADLFLKKSFLELPERVKFDLQDSLYSFALRLVENKKNILSERPLLPAKINNFVNKNFYAQRLRLVPSAQENKNFLPELVRVELDEKKLTGQVNEQEAAYIMQKLVAFLNMSEYEGKTFAVITLGGSEQQELLENLILDQVPEEQIARHRIICTTADNYLSGLRDIVLLSFVSAKIAELVDPRKLNSILQLVHEQLFLFLPFAAADLLQYSLVTSLLGWDDKVQEDKLNSDKPATVIIEDICKLLTEKGYKARGAYQPGNLPLSLDIVVEVGTQKIAVIIDGIRGKKQLDEMLLEEDTLSQQGWNFWHLRACKFYTDKEKSLEGLCEFLENYV